MIHEVRGWHVFAVFAIAFGIIIGVNTLLAVNAVRTFPGLEVKNSYVASQSFDSDRAAQVSLDWDVSAGLHGNQLTLAVAREGSPITPVIESAVFGRATNVLHDQTPDFAVTQGVFKATVIAGPGNWNLRVKLRADDGTLFQRRIALRSAP